MVEMEEAESAPAESQECWYVCAHKLHVYEGKGQKLTLREFNNTHHIQRCTVCSCLCGKFHTESHINLLENTVSTATLAALAQARGQTGL